MTIKLFFKEVRIICFIILSCFSFLCFSQNDSINTIFLKEVVLNYSKNNNNLVVKTPKRHSTYYQNIHLKIIPISYYKNEKLKGKLVSLKLFFDRNKDYPENIENEFKIIFYRIKNKNNFSKDIIENSEKVFDIRNPEDYFEKIITDNLIFKTNNKKEEIYLDLSVQDVFLDGYILVELEKLTNKDVSDYYIKTTAPKKDSAFFFNIDGMWSKIDFFGDNLCFKMEMEIKPEKEVY